MSILWMQSESHSSVILAVWFASLLCWKVILNPLYGPGHSWAGFPQGCTSTLICKFLPSMMCHWTEGIGQVMSSSWFLPYMRLGIQAKELDFSSSRSEIPYGAFWQFQQLLKCLLVRPRHTTIKTFTIKVMQSACGNIFRSHFICLSVVTSDQGYTPKRGITLFARLPLGRWKDSSLSAPLVF